MANGDGPEIHAVAAIGTILWRGNEGVGEAWTKICGITTLNGPAGDKDVLEVTNHCSEGGYKQYIGGAKDGGEVTMDMNLVPTDPAVQQILSDFESRDTNNWRITFPDGEQTGEEDSEVRFAGFVTHFEFQAPIDGALTASVTIKVTGQVTLLPSGVEPVGASAGIGGGGGGGAFMDSEAA